MSVTRSLDDGCSRKHADTYLNTDSFSYTWQIYNFNTTPFESYRRGLKSPKFVKRHNSTTITWWISFIEKTEFYTFHRCEINRIHLGIVGQVSEECKITANVEFFIVHKYMWKTVYEHIWGASQLCQPGLELNFATYLSYNNIDQLIRDGFCPNDILTIHCDITILDEQIGMNNHQIPNCQLPDDIVAMLETRKFCDVKLMVNCKEFHAHKFMLAARSSVFAAMFEREMAEKNNSTIEIINIDNEVFEEVLRYIYTGKILSLTIEMAIELLVVAKKYDLNGLIIICEVFIDKNITMDNVADVLIVADKHCSRLLKVQAVKFINMHTIGVMNTNGFKSMCKSHPHLAEECLSEWLKG